MKRILITGGGRRIGRALALGFGAAGWHVIVHHNASRNEAEAVVGTITGEGGSAETVQADLARPAAAKEMLAGLLAGGAIDGLINNAAAFKYDAPEDIDEAFWDHAMATNLRAPVQLSSIYCRAVRERGDQGLIINILDNKLFALNPDFFSYTVSKAALLAATKMMAMAFAPAVRVCAIAPGITLQSGRQTRESFEKAHRMNPLGRGCTPADIVGAAIFIAETACMTGQVVTLDGGQSLMRLPRDVAFLDQSDLDPAEIERLKAAGTSDE